MVDGLEGIEYLSASSFLFLGLSSRAMRIKFQELLPWVSFTYAQRSPMDLVESSALFHEL